MRLNFIQKFRIPKLIALACTSIELLEDREQHQGDHDPNSYLREPLIVHRDSFIQFGPIAQKQALQPCAGHMGSILLQSRAGPDFDGALYD
ncbi:hypothetical protein [Roseateles oligotrophus]|uniref:hypothetical protein n=1 Tax=Roseateles oligotrophus TaxID=1769250 RepID=UPI001FECFB36|nr:hypothetical protein [Roseateles oligotrophus]